MHISLILNSVLNFGLKYKAYKLPNLDKLKHLKQRHKQFNAITYNQ